MQALLNYVYIEITEEQEYNYRAALERWGGMNTPYRYGTVRNLGPMVSPIYEVAVDDEVVFRTKDTIFIESNAFLVLDTDIVAKE